MRINVSPSVGAQFFAEIDDTTTVRQLKETIEATMLDQFWTAATMTLFYGNIELQNNSTLYQNNVTEMSTVHALSYVDQYQGTPFPTEDAEMILNNGDDSSGGNLEFNLDDLLEIPSEPVDVKFILPHNFQANIALNFSATYHFQTSGQLRDKIDNDPPTWLPKFEAYAILSNADVFLAENVNDLRSRKNGAVALVRNCDYGDALHQGRGYKFSAEAPTPISIEKSAGKFKIAGEINLDRYEIMGNIWTRRRIKVAGEDTFSLIQWLSTNSKKKDTVKEDVSTAVKTVGELKLKLDTVAIDVTDIKQDVANIKQGLTDIHTTLAALVDRLPPQPAPDPDTPI